MPSELKKRQLEAVLDLLGHLNSYSFDIGNYRFDGINYSNKMIVRKRNFFNYHKVFEADRDLESFAELSVFMLQGDIHPFDLTRFLENPLLPKEIADQLSPFINIFLHKQSNDKQIELNSEILVFNESKNPIQGDIQQNQLYKPVADSLKQNKEFILSINKR